MWTEMAISTTLAVQDKDAFQLIYKTGIVSAW